MFDVYSPKGGTAMHHFSNYRNNFFPRTNAYICFILHIQLQVDINPHLNASNHISQKIIYIIIVAVSLQCFYFFQSELSWGENIEFVTASSMAIFHPLEGYYHPSRFGGRILEHTVYSLTGYISSNKSLHLDVTARLYSNTYII